MRKDSGFLFPLLFRRLLLPRLLRHLDYLHSTLASLVMSTPIQGILGHSLVRYFSELSPICQDLLKGCLDLIGWNGTPVVDDPGGIDVSIVGLEKGK